MRPRENVRLLVVTVLTVLASPAAPFCPSMCLCDDGALDASCSGARLDSVPILLNPSLRSLHLAHNRIASLRQSVSFYGELRRLDLSHNALHSLGLYHFQPLVHLQHLNVSSNVISSLEPESFAGLGALTVLDLSANRLTRLTAGLFIELGHLTELVLSSNKIQSVAEGAFDGLPSLHTLRLEDNNLGHVPSGPLAALSASLLSLHLSKNLVEALEEGAFRSLGALQTLRLNDNAIGRVEPGAFRSLHSLHTLDLSFNRLDGAPESFAVPGSGLGSLVHLDLSGNMWRSLPAAFLSALTRLETLNVSYMEYLRHVDPDAFRGARSVDDEADDVPALPLAQLVMTNNALLKHLPRRVLRGLEQRLVRLDVSGNALETLDLSGAEWPSLRFLSAAYNPLECNCSLLWLWRKLNRQRDDSPSPSALANESRAPIDAHHRLSVMNVTCNGPPPLAGHSLGQLQVSQLDCALDVPVSLVVSLVVIWTAVSVGLAAAFLFWRRRSRHRLDGRLVMIKSTKPVDHPYEQHRGAMSPALGGQLKANYPFFSAAEATGVHVAPTRSVSPSPGSTATVLTSGTPPLQHYGFEHGTLRTHYGHQPVYQQPFAHQYPQHQLSVSVRDEYTYHGHGGARRVPVTIV